MPNITVSNDIHSLMQAANVASARDALELGTADTPSFDEVTVDVVNFDTSANEASLTEGKLSWDTDRKTLRVGTFSNEEIHLGQITCYSAQNATGSIIPKGTLVHFDGTVGNSGNLRVSPWTGAEDATTIMGIALTAFAAGVGEAGFVVDFGEVRGINTTGSLYGEEWFNGDILYASPSGGLTKVLPSEIPIVVVAAVTSAHSSGSLFIRVNIGQTAASVGAAALNHTHSAFTGDSGSGGAAGFVPAPAAGDAAAGKYLDADGTWTVPAGGGGSGGSTNVWIPASAWIPKTTAGCGVDSRETTTNDQNFDELLFDAGTDEFADALVKMPNNYNNGTVSGKFYWTASTGSGSVIWGLQGRAFADDDALDTAAGTAQTVTDTLIVADDMHVSSATSAITIGGTPSANTPIQFSIFRDANNAGDTIANDCRLLGVEILYTSI